MSGGATLSEVAGHLNYRPGPVLGKKLGFDMRLWRRGRSAGLYHGQGPIGLAKDANDLATENVPYYSVSRFVPRHVFVARQLGVIANGKYFGPVGFNLRCWAKNGPPPVD
jgi:hypothetical protein